jgi:tetratricopeptide (TPR) repeat protein
MKAIVFFLLILFTHVGLVAQTDFPALKQQFLDYRKANKQDSALFIARKMNQLSQQEQTDTSFWYGLSLGFMGKIYFGLNDIDSSIYCLKKSIQLIKYQSDTIDNDLVENYLILFDGLKSLNQFTEIEPLLIELIELYKERNDYASCFNLYYNLALLYKFKDDYDQSISSFKQLTEFNQKYLNNSLENLAFINLALAEVYFDNSEYIQSIEFCEKSLDHFKRQKDDQFIYEEIRALNQIGLSLVEIENYNLAENYFNRLKTRINMIKDSIDYLSSFYHNLGLLNWKRGNYEESKGYYLKALQVDSILGFTSDITYLNLGILFLEIGDYKESERLFLEALEINKQNSKELNSIYPIILKNLSGLYSSLGNFRLSNKYLNEAIESYDKLGLFNLDYVKALLSLIDNYAISKDFKSAEQGYLTVKEKLDSMLGHNHSDFASFLNVLGEFYLNQGKIELAQANIDSSLIILNRASKDISTISAQSYHLLGACYFFQKDYEQAKMNWLKSCEIQKRVFPGGNYNNSVVENDLSAVLILLKDFKSAYSHQLESMTIRINYLRHDFSFLNSFEKYMYWQQEKDFYEIMNSFSVSAVDSVLSCTELSYNANIISKSLLLESSRELDQAIAQSSDEALKAQFSEMKQLLRIYSKMKSEGSENKEIMERYKSQADSLDKILVNKIGEYAASKRKFEITWKDVQFNLATTDAAIEFARYYDEKDSLYKYMALVVRPDYEYPKLVTLGEEDAIRTAVQNKDFSTLYNEAWKGIDSLLVGVKRVYFSPSGEINNISFSALCIEEGNELVAANNQKNRGVVTGNNNTPTKACNAVLMDKYELHQLTTTRYLADGTLTKEKPMQPSLALVGGINFDDIPDKTNEAEKEQSNEDFAFHANLNKQFASTNGKKRGKRSSSNYGKKMDPLPGTKEEILNIGGLMNTSNWKVQTKSDKKAGEYEFKKELETKAPGVLHIATHGFAFPDEAKKETSMMSMEKESTYKVSEDPMVRCGLMLGGSNISWTGNPQKMIEQTGDDGILTAAEVANLDLTNTKLVVLSACETGLGKIEGSEGTFGLKRGFKLAGVEQIIVSLWSVPDKETMELMTLFYTNLTKTLNPVISFEKAQNEMRNRYPTDPEKWAGFVLVR